MDSFRQVKKKVIRKFYDDYVTEVSIMKSGWKDRYLIIYEFGDIEQVKLEVWGKERLLRNLEDLTEKELKLLE